MQGPAGHTTPLPPSSTPPPSLAEQFSAVRPPSEQQAAQDVEAQQKWDVRALLNEAAREYGGMITAASDFLTCHVPRRQPPKAREEEAEPDAAPDAAPA